jgi:hypothetical protein
MSFNLLNIIYRILPTPAVERVSEIDGSVGLGRDSKDNSEKVQARQPENSETAISEPDSSPKLSSQTLLSVFRKAECCTLDGLNEYDDDFTSFTPLGDVVTHEMQQAADRLAKQALQSVNRESSETINGDVVTTQTSVDE